MASKSDVDEVAVHAPQLADEVAVHARKRAPRVFFARIG
jgi:hypothetical protein